jgi:phosphohistidine phosphatase
VADRLQIHLLRHADAGDPETWVGPDAARPLSDKGRRQAERLGRHLAAIGFRPDAIISSPKVRADETATLVAQALDAVVGHDDRLASGLDLAALEAIVRERGSPRRVVLVGHDPDFSVLLSTLVAAETPMKKGALARVDVVDGLRPGGAVLRWLLPPDLVPER